MDLIGVPKYISIPMAIMGGAPDFIGWLEKKIKQNDCLWNWYKWTHSYKIWQILIPTWALHIFVDKYFHNTGGGWNKYALPVEIILWFLNFTYFLIKYLI
jgi:hypothetical protein